MASSSMQILVHDLRQAVLRDGNSSPDSLLLEQFVRQRDESALAAIVHRHSPMVWGVCRRILASHQDAEDAFQATFLVLVRKAASIQRKELLANWLYGVARQTAVRARALAAKQGRRERQVHEMPELARAEPDPWDSLRPLLDEEMSRLPEKYRTLLILCDLQGKTRKEAAAELACPEGTIAGRLARARAMLSKRLARRGITASASALVALLASHAAVAAPPAVVSSTVQAALTYAAGGAATTAISAKAIILSEGMLRSMFLAKLKLTAVYTFVCICLAIGGFAAHHALADSGNSLAQQEGTALEAANPELLVQERAQRPQPKDGASVTGKLESVDAQKNSLTLSTPPAKRGDAPVSKVFELAKDAKIQRDGQDIKLAELKTGAQATLKLSADQKAVVSVTQATPAVSSPLKSVDAAKSTITITVGNRTAKEDKTYSVAKDAKITVDGKAANLADLRQGTPVTVVIEQNVVTQIRTAMRKDRKQDN